MGRSCEPKNLKLQKSNSRKSVRWSALPVPCLSRLWFKLRGEQGSGPEEVDDICFHTFGGKRKTDKKGGDVKKKESGIVLYC